MPICLDRERRANAGSKMARLLNDEDEDDFYTTIYGGFTEEAEDNDYESETSVEDSMDSDFLSSSDSDADNSNEESYSDQGDDKKHRRVVTKSYKEPKRAKIEKRDAAGKAVKERPSSSVKGGGNEATVAKSPIDSDAVFERPVLRPRPSSSTHSGKTGDQKEGASAIRRKALLSEIAQRKNVPEVRRLTQEELLAEAKVTEEINKRSLARYQRLEIEKKKARFQKTTHSVPMIRFHSFAAPLIDNQPELYATSFGDDNSSSNPSRLGPLITDRSSEARCCRNLITFPVVVDREVAAAGEEQDNWLLQSRNSTKKEPRRRHQCCPISGLKARYRDPVTLTPFANLAAFKQLRQLYASHLVGESG